MSRGAVAQKLREQQVDACKKWLCDTTSISVRQGLKDILSLNNLSKQLSQFQISYLKSRLLEDVLGVSGLFQQCSSSESENDMQLSEGRSTIADGTLTVDDVITIETNYISPIVPYDYIRSRPKFVKLMYQYISCFPAELFEAYTEITGESLLLDDLSEVREFYKNCSALDSWTGHQLCAYLSHCNPEVLNFISENPKKSLPVRLYPLFLMSDLFDENVPLVKAAILGEAFELVHLDRDNWEKSSLNPKKGLEWAKKKGIEYHPVLDELLLDVKPAPTPSVLSSGYTTPYLEIIQEGIIELGISKENQGKKEAMTAWFLQRLIDRGLPRSRRIADAMATISRSIESQQGRAKR